MFVCAVPSSQAQENISKGNLFIIGGGERPPSLLQKLIHTAQLGKADYVVVLPMSSEEPDSSFYYFKNDLEKECTNAIVNFNFTPAKINYQPWLDSLRKAKLVFITGGDQVRFMKIVLHSPIYDAIHFAYRNGATVAGTSAGAAVMPKQMMTGNQLKGDKTYHETIDKLVTDNIEFTEGLGMVDSVIIDQHFIVRSRYNRLISSLVKFPFYTCIGINEATAIIIHGKKAEVTGVGQAEVMSDPTGISITENGLIKLKGMRFSIYTSGDVFEIK
ncbi:MAG: cyanophycinase [Bacteroidetes bacterium]|nr:cyanophycinase [Bacteroidota bacterium]